MAVGIPAVTGVTASITAEEASSITPMASAPISRAENILSRKPSARV